MLQTQRKRDKKGGCVVHKPVPLAGEYALVETTPEGLGLMYLKLADSVPLWDGLMVAERIPPECAVRLAEGAEVESVVQSPEVERLFSRLGIEAAARGSGLAKYDVLLAATPGGCCWLVWLL
ncbi:MAG: hypothetical protein QXI84_09290 [Thermofilaceae archaeon]